MLTVKCEYRILSGAYSVIELCNSSLSTWWWNSKSSVFFYQVNEASGHVAGDIWAVQLNSSHHTHYSH